MKKAIFVFVLNLIFLQNSKAQADVLGYFLPGTYWGMQRSELAEIRAVDINSAGSRPENGYYRLKENLDGDPIVSVEYLFSSRPDSLGLVGLYLICIDRESAAELAEVFTGNEIQNGSGDVLKLPDGSGLQVILRNVRLEFYYRSIRLSNARN
jgi:hypothetical protein